MPKAVRWNDGLDDNVNTEMGMEISLETMIQKHNNCVAALDENKHCDSCRYKDCAQDAKPCADCYNELLGMPVNPTNWEMANA